jgi:4-hydroxy-tetrahydrodipicolinate synthase
MFKGSITALATPFADGKVDEAGLRSLFEWQIFAGIIARGNDDGR